MAWGDAAAEQYEKDQPSDPYIQIGEEIEADQASPNQAVYSMLEKPK